MTGRILGGALWGSLVLALLVRLLTLGLYPVAETTEARYAELARKMVALNDWITPWHDAGVPFWAKPPLAMWLSAGSIRLFGVNEFAARLPHFLMALAILWLLWDWLRRDDTRTAQYAAALLAGAVLFYVAAGAVMTDMALALGLMLVLRGFWRALHAPPPTARREGYAVFVGLALGLLAKGPIALVLAGVPIALWTLATRNVRAVARALPWFTGGALMLALALPWYVAAELKTPGFLDYFLIGEHWQRFTVAGWSGDRYGSAHAFARGSIWLFALAACLPWVLLLPVVAIGRARALSAVASIPAAAHTRARRGYLALWALTPAVFFTPAGNILWTYVLPALPPLAALAAEWLAADPRVRRVERTLAAGVLVTAAVFAAAIAANRAFDIANSAAPVVRAYAAHQRAAEPLLFFGDYPHSAAFYTYGRAERIGDAAVLARRLNAAGAAYVAFRPARLLDLPTDLRATLCDLGAYGRYRLYFHARAAELRAPGWPCRR